VKKEKETYKLPDNYFEEFRNQLQTQIELEQVLGPDKKSDFTVPEDYFSTLSRKLTQIPSQTEAKVIRLKPRYWPAIGIAAAVLLIFGLWVNTTDATDNPLELDDIAAYLDTESADLSTEDILSLLSEEDLNTIVLTDESQPDEDILNYLENYSNSYDLLLE